MHKRFTLTLCLLLGASWTSGIAPFALAQTPNPATVAPVVAPQQTAPTAALTLEDLPEGFQELPPQVTAELITQFDSFRNQLAQSSLKPEKFFAFVNRKDFQVIVGFTGTLPNQPEQATFDASLKQLQEPEVQQQMMNQFRQGLKAAPGIEFINYSPLPELNNVAEAGTGMSVAVSMQGKPVRLDIASFRRNRVGAVAAVMYTDGQAPLISVNDVVRKLDNRILQFSPATNPPKPPEVR